MDKQRIAVLFRIKPDKQDNAMLIRESILQDVNAKEK